MAKNTNLTADKCCLAPQLGCLTDEIGHARTQTHTHRAREALRQCLPDLLRNPQFTGCLKSDDTTRRWLAQLLVNVGFTDSAAQLSADVLTPTPLQGQ